ncbi:unnamed protein product [Closterium sp. Naga37s-1]|nr:unnamed protein product [Closterium sp. Naga37s-1]
MSSASGSPAGSGRLMPGSGGSGQGSGSLEPTYSGGFNESGGRSGEYDESGGGYGAPVGSSYGQYQQYPARGGAPQGGGWGGGGGGMNAPYGGMMGGGVAPRGQYGSNDSSPQGSGPMQPSYHPASGGGGSGSLQSRFSMDGGSMDSSPGGGGPKGGSDIQQAAALSALAWSKQAANTAEGQKLQSDYLAEFDAWKRANQAATFQQQQDFMSDLQSRMSKARAALAGLQLGEGGGAGGGGSPAGGGGGEMGGDGGGGGGMQHAYPAAIPAPVPAASDVSSVGGGGGVENDLRRELELMRQRAAEAEKARLEAEQRAQRALSEADRSLREVEAQNKRRELETAVRIEMASQEAARAMAAAEEARKQAELEAQKTEVAMKQAAMTRAALELEEKRRQEAEKKAKSEKGSMRMMANYREYSYDDIVFATENFKPDRKLGEGGFGTVFSGTLHHTPVAVKVLKNTDAMQAAHEFQQEGSGTVFSGPLRCAAPHHTPVAVKVLKNTDAMQAAHEFQQEGSGTVFSGPLRCAAPHHTPVAVKVLKNTDAMQAAHEFQQEGSGTVFSGPLRCAAPHHTPVAVKVLKNTDAMQAAHEFQQEGSGTVFSGPLRCAAPHHTPVAVKVLKNTDAMQAAHEFQQEGSGTVFSGPLRCAAPHHTPVAVKVLKNTDAMQAAHEFQQEVRMCTGVCPPPFLCPPPCLFVFLYPALPFPPIHPPRANQVEVMSQIQHPHVVMLLGCCPDRYCLVYEFMANGSLEDHLLCANNTPHSSPISSPTTSSLSPAPFLPSASSPPSLLLSAFSPPLRPLPLPQFPLLPQVEVLSQIQHPHVVMLLGCCPDRYCLVYEFMANGSLEDRLLCANNSPPLPWYIRMRVAAEIASALLILHTRPVPIVHRDLKPGNILLDKNFVAKLGDVGLAKLMPGLSMDQTYMRESVPVGTFAYVDPEFQRTGEFGPKSDVYALGIVLLDLLTGRKPNVYEGLEEAVDDGDEEAMREFLDERAGNWPLDIVMEVAKIAVKCSEMRRKKRPDLETHVMPVLDRARARAVQAEEEARKTPAKRSIGDAPSSLFCPITQASLAPLFLSHFSVSPPPVSLYSCVCVLSTLSPAASHFLPRTGEMVVKTRCRRRTSTRNDGEPGDGSGRAQEMMLNPVQEASTSTLSTLSPPLPHLGTLFRPLSPLSTAQEMMVNPVLAADGHTYEKEAIESWLESSDRSPMTNEQLPSKDLVPNHAVRAMIKDWRERNL